MKNNKHFYYLASNSNFDIENYEELILNKQDLENLNFDFYSSFDFTASSNIITKKTYKRPRLSDVIYDYIMDYSLKNIDDDNDLQDLIDIKLEELLTENYVIRYDKKLKNYSIVKEDELLNCFRQVIDNYNNSLHHSITNEHNFTLSEKCSMTYDKYITNNEKNRTYLKDDIIDVIEKCMNPHNRAHIILTHTIYDETETIEFDVKINKKNKIVFGKNKSDSESLYDEILESFVNGSTCFLRVTTNENINKISVIKIFAFIFFQHNDEFIIENFSATDVEEALNVDYTTGKKLKPEPNVVYTDINNNFICSWDLM